MNSTPNFLSGKLYFKSILPQTKSASSKEDCGRYFDVRAHRRLKKPLCFFSRYPSSFIIQYCLVYLTDITFVTSFVDCSRYSSNSIILSLRSVSKSNPDFQPVFCHVCSYFDEMNVSALYSQLSIMNPNCAKNVLHSSQ